MTRSLVVAAALPIPAYSGAALRTWQNVVALADAGPVGVFGLRAEEPAPPPREGIELWCSSRDPVLTKPTTSPLDWLRDRGAVPSDQYYSPGALAEIEDSIGGFAPDVVVLEELWLHRYVAPLAERGWRLVLDTSTVESAYNRELAARSPRPAALVRTKLAERMEVIEATSFAAVDQVWVCSREDAQTVRDLHRPATPLALVPNTVDVDAYLPPQTYAARPTLVFPAMFAYPPNEAAALLLAREIVPRLSGRFPDVRLMLVGRNPTRAMLATAAADPRVVITDAVRDVRPHLAGAGAVPVPLFDGGGTRLKILEAFAAGVPVVSTAKGVEGLDVTADAHFVHAEDPGAFVAALTRLWSEPKEASRLVARARSLVVERYSWDVARRAVADALVRLPAPRSS